MDQTLANQPQVSPISPPPNVPPQAQRAPVTYASFGRRFVAALIDSVIIIIINFILGGITNIVTPRDSILSSSFTASTSILQFLIPGVVALIQIIINYGYYIYFIGSRGQTLGKMAMKIKVVKVDSTAPPGFVHAFLREVIGKFLSLLVVGVGYLWMLWDAKKQCWHDKLAHTIVIKV